MRRNTRSIEPRMHLWFSTKPPNRLPKCSEVKQRAHLRVYISPLGILVRLASGGWMLISSLNASSTSKYVSLNQQWRKYHINSFSVSFFNKQFSFLILMISVYQMPSELYVVILTQCKLGYKHQVLETPRWCRFWACCSMGCGQQVAS